MADPWEFCPHCESGFPNYLGTKKGFYQFECDQCEAFFKVEVGTGTYKQRIGMELKETVVYLQVCDVCKKTKPVKLNNLRFICKGCARES